MRGRGRCRSFSARIWTRFAHVGFAVRGVCNLGDREPACGWAASGASRDHRKFRTFGQSGGTRYFQQGSSAILAGTQGSMTLCISLTREPYLLVILERQSCANHITASDAQRLMIEASQVLDKQQFTGAEEDTKEGVELLSGSRFS